MQGAKNGVTHMGNEYFGNAAEEQNKAAELGSYIFLIPYQPLTSKHSLEWYNKYDY